MKLWIPPKVSEILDILHSHGYEAYVVGGCVRDSILARTPDDWDITTSAKPEEVKKLFRRTVDTGLQHGTVTVLLGNDGYEVTTYRLDGEYEDSRHPKEVTFTSSLEEDLKRRDFTINAMAYNQEEGLVDLFGGMRDLQGKVIRAVGEPKERFTEDALRIMRAVRFSAQLGFTIDEKTYEALAELSPNLKHISAERIQVELVKILTSKHPEYLEAAWETGITRVILPEFDAMMETAQNTPHHCYDVGRHTLVSLMAVPADKVLRLTMLLHDVGKPVVRTTDEQGQDHFKGHEDVGERMASEILKRLKMDNDTISKVCRLIHWHDYQPVAVEKGIRRAVNRVGEDIFPFLLQIQLADTMAKSDFGREKRLEQITKTQQIYEGILEANQCLSLKSLAVTGKDLIAMGMQPGKGIGQMLDFLLEKVLDEPDYNKKEYLLSLAKRRLESQSR